MANRRKQSDLRTDFREEAQLEELLRTGYGEPLPTKEFQETLLQRLDREFVATYHLAPATTPAADADGSPGRRPRRRIGLRLAVSMATAAS